MLHNYCRQILASKHAGSNLWQSMCFYLKNLVRAAFTIFILEPESSSSILIVSHV